MKRILLSLMILHSPVFYSNAATITWIGASGSNWNNVTNWSPGSVPTANDDVIFNTSVTVEMDIIPAVTPFIYLINSLMITGNSLVTLTRTQATGGTRVLQLKSTGNVVYGLRIDNGSTLTINAANAAGTLTFILDLAGAAGVTGQVAGNLYFTGTGIAGGGDAHLNIYTGPGNYANLTVKNTGVVKYFTNSGNTNSAAGSVLTMESGSVYEINKNGGSLPYGNWDDNSTVLITGATSNGNIFFSQSQYGNLIWNCPLMSAATQMISNLSPVTAVSLNNFTVSNTNARELRLKTGASLTVYDYTVRGNLNIAAPSILAITGNTVTMAGGGARLHVMGSLTNAGILKADGAAGTVNDLELKGNANQNVSNTGIFSGMQLKFIMNNAAGATLLTSLTLPGTIIDALQLNNGKIKTTTSAILTMPDNSNYTGGSSASFIEGPMEKIGDDNTFSFPVGKGSIYAPITFYSLGLTVTDAFRAEYFRQNPQTIYGINYEAPPIEHISYVEYWQLQKTNGSTSVPVNVTLSITPYSFAKDISTLYIARYNPSDLQWKNSGITFKSSGAPSPPYITGSITSSPLTQFGIFTLASSVIEAINPLPLNIISFEVKKINSNSAILNWKLSDYSNHDTKFEVLRSANRIDFTSIGIISGSETRRDFDFYDHQFSKGVIRYMLKLTDANGLITYSQIATLTNNPHAFITTSVSPNPFYDNAVIGISSDSPVKVNFRLYDVGGKIIKRWDESILAGNSTVTIRGATLCAGVYILSINTMDTRQILRLIKK